MHGRYRKMANDFGEDASSRFEREARSALIEFAPRFGQTS